MNMRLLIVFAAMSAQLAWAQTPPPKLEPIQDSEVAPDVTIHDNTDQRVEEYRIKGRLYMIKITPKIGKPYYLIDQKGDGVFARYDGLDTGLKVPQWVVLKW